MHRAAYPKAFRDDVVNVAPGDAPVETIKQVAADFGIAESPFLQFDREFRRIVCTTNAIESVNARIRKAVKARGHLRHEQAALKRPYLAIMALDRQGSTEPSGPSAGSRH